MKNILEIGQKSKKALENFKRVKHKKINKALDDFINLILDNKKKLLAKMLKM